LAAGRPDAPLMASQVRLRSSSTCWRRAGPYGRRLRTTARWPCCPPVHGRCRSPRRGGRRSRWLWTFRTRLPRAFRVQRAMAERHLRASLLRPNGRVAQRSAGAGRGIDAHGADARESGFGQVTDIHRGQQRAMPLSPPANRGRAVRSRRQQPLLPRVDGRSLVPRPVRQRRAWPGRLEYPTLPRSLPPLRSSAIRTIKPD
jgi:hypothetical protein